MTYPAVNMYIAESIRGGQSLKEFNDCQIEISNRQEENIRSIYDDKCHDKDLYPAEKILVEQALKSLNKLTDQLIKTFEISDKFIQNPDLVLDEDLHESTINLQRKIEEHGDIMTNTISTLLSINK